MSPENSTTIDVDGLKVNLKSRELAALLAWLVPGLGHLYQGRKTKAWIFFVCILSAWILGFALGGGHVVYASWVPGDKRWHYVLQVGVGAVALPAVVQTSRMKKATDKLGRISASYKPLWGGFMAPPLRPVIERDADEVSAWYARWGAGYEMGTWYTVIAGLLNILVIYDAYGGPLSVPISGRRSEQPSTDSNEKE